jgi:hydroxymethylpyrimidine pyrophosphatase-like HAD family hydrolase
MKAVIFDLDGTLCDDSHRMHLLGSPGVKKDYKAYNALLHLDKVKEAVKMTLNGFHMYGCKIFLVTGRFEEVREATEKWLVENQITYDGLVMRDNKDYRSGDIVKREELNKIRACGYDVIAAFEDRQKLIDMFREEGLVCFAVENREN